MNRGGSDVIKAKKIPAIPVQLKCPMDAIADQCKKYFFKNIFLNIACMQDTFYFVLCSGGGLRCEMVKSQLLYCILIRSIFTNGEERVN